MDLVVEVPALTTIPGTSTGEERSADVRSRVLAARRRQRDRFAREFCRLNAEMEAGTLGEFCGLDARATRLFETAARRFLLSARGCDRVLRVSRTIADLAGATNIEHEHLAESLQYRLPD